MKSIIILLSAILALSVNAQNYLNPTSTWKEYSGYCSGNTCYSTDYSITLVGDTLIEGHKYYKTYLAGIETYWYWGGSIISQKPITFFLDPIREEDYKIYKYDIASHKEDLLHNFKLSISDTANTDCSHLQIVEKIDTVQIGNISRKRFFFKDNKLDYLIEGVGSKQALFIKPCDFIGFEGGSILQCYSQDGQYIQVDTNTVCGNITSVDHNILEDFSYSMYPNPVNDNLEISFNTANKKELTLNLFNLQGSKLLERNIVIGSGSINLDTSNLFKGIYIVVLKSATNSYSKKLIKM